MSQILESFLLKDRMVSLCIYKARPCVVVQDGDLRYECFDDITAAIEVFSLICEYWVEEDRVESGLFTPEVSA